MIGFWMRRWFLTRSLERTSKRVIPFDPDALHVTDGGNYRVKKETALAQGTDFDELTGHSIQTKLDGLTDNK